MKNGLFPVLAGLWLCFASAEVNAQDVKTHISKELAAKSVFALYNLSGSVKIEGYSGSKIILEADQTIRPKTPQGLEEAKGELKVEFEESGDSVKVYLSGPFDTRPNRGQNNRNERRNREYNFNIDFTVKVPVQTILRVSTVNGGMVSVKDVAGKLNLSNINGSISVENAKGATEAATVNGKITASYNSSPGSDSNFKTVNGDLRVTFPANFAGDVHMKTLNGGFYTNFSETEAVAEVSKTKDARTGMTTYRTNREQNIRIGGGGKQFKFETVNGSVYIQKQQ